MLREEAPSFLYFTATTNVRWSLEVTLATALEEAKTLESGDLRFKDMGLENHPNANQIHSDICWPLNSLSFGFDFRNTRR